jgi:hypothetical protein
VDWRSSTASRAVYDDDANFITRMNLETMQPMDVPKVDKTIVDLIRDLQYEGRL